MEGPQDSRKAAGALQIPTARHDNHWGMGVSRPPPRYRLVHESPQVYAEHGSGQCLGAELFGPRVEHMAHLLAWMLERTPSVSRILEIPVYHPVLEEGLRSALRDLNANLQRGPAITECCMACGPGD